VEVAGDFAQRRFAGEFRAYQRQALEAFDADRAAGSTRSYLVLPPGAGKTAIGLEAARRIGTRTLVLVPNTAVLGQWARTWDRDFAGASPAGTDRSLARPLTVLTYQSIAVIDDDTEASTRRAVVRSGDHEALLALLHENGRAVIERAAATGPWTLVLDECHHLLATWGVLVRAVVDALGSSTSVIGLTATPPALLTGRQRELRDELFGSRDFEVATPALVKEGDLAPYQELVYLTAPTIEEDTWLVAHGSRFVDLQADLVGERLGSIPLMAWLRRRVGERGTAAGAQLSWAAFETEEPALALSALRFANAGFMPVPDGARVREQHRVPPSAADWVCVLSDFALRHLQASADERDKSALAQIKAVLPSLGYRLTRRGVVSTTSPVDRVCGLSESKIAAAVHILECEDGALGADLRALVLCDFESQPARLPAGLRGAPLTTDSGSARLAFASLAAAVVRQRGALRPLLVTGATFAAPASLAAELIAFAAGDGLALSATAYEQRDALCVLTGPGITARQWVDVATRFFAAGHARVLVGTRALLGEGWDCPEVNVTVDLTTATTPTAIVQMRGRSLRLDTHHRDKVADNWSVCCVAPDHPGGEADYGRLVRKHDAYFALAADGTIESGISHCDPALSPFGPPAAEAAAQLTAAALARAPQRAAALALWAVGEPYAGVTGATVRVRAGRTLGGFDAAVPISTLLAPLPGHRPHRSRVGGALAGLAGLAGASTGLASGLAPGVLSAAFVAVGGIAALTAVSAARAGSGPDAGALERLAWVVADALLAAGGAARGAAAVAFEVTADGWQACRLTDVPAEEADRFAAALDELLAPIGEPRYLVGRVVLTPRRTRTARTVAALRSRLGLSIEGAVSWHSVPVWFAANRARRAAFTEAWRAHVGPPRLLGAGTPEGQAVVDLFRGEDPFSIVTQLRTTWS